MKNFYLIGLTGSLGSGKSTVRLLLEQFGAFGIDADLLAHEAMRLGSRAWFAIVSEYGLGILKWTGEINRKRLGKRVFANPKALVRLEQILHPAVNTRIKDLLRQTNASVIVIEAIKLIEANLNVWCDAVWVVTCNPEVQIERVRRDRQMSAPDAQARLDAQRSLDEKLKFATIVIDNSADIRSTRSQAQRAWDAIRPQTARDKTSWLYGAAPIVTAPPIPVSPRPHVESTPTAKPKPTAPEPHEIRRARKGDLDALAIAFGKREHLPGPLSPAETLQRFGARGYRIAMAGKDVVAFVAWDAENLVAVASQMWAESVPASSALAQLMTMIEGEAKQLQCEVLLVLTDSLTPSLVIDRALSPDYQLRNMHELHPVWRQVARDRIDSSDKIRVKLLRQELVTQPF